MNSLTFPGGDFAEDPCKSSASAGQALPRSLVVELATAAACQSAELRRFAAWTSGEEAAEYVRRAECLRDLAKRLTGSSVVALTSGGSHA